MNNRWSQNLTLSLNGFNLAVLLITTPLQGGMCIKTQKGQIKKNQNTEKKHTTPKIFLALLSSIVLGNPGETNAIRRGLFLSLYIYMNKKGTPIGRPHNNKTTCPSEQRCLVIRLSGEP